MLSGKTNTLVPSSGTCCSQSHRSEHSSPHHDLYGVEIETKDPYPIIGHVHFKKPVLEGGFSVRHRMISLIVHPIDQRATRYLYVHSDPLQRNRAYVRSISFRPEVDLEAYSDPTVR